jgi:hypothetical protein
MDLGASGQRWDDVFIGGNVNIDSDLLVGGVIYSLPLAGSGRRYLCIEDNGAITADNVAC